MQLLDLDKFDPAVREWPTSKLLMMSSMFATWFYPADSVLKWHGDIRLYATEPRYQQLVKEGPPVRTAMIRGFNRVAVEGEALEQYQRAFDKWLGRDSW